MGFLTTKIKCSNAIDSWLRRRVVENFDEYFKANKKLAEEAQQNATARNFAAESLRLDAGYILEFYTLRATSYTLKSGLSIDDWTPASSKLAHSIAYKLYVLTRDDSNVLRQIVENPANGIRTFLYNKINSKDYGGEEFPDKAKKLICELGGFLAGRLSGGGNSDKLRSLGDYEADYDKGFAGAQIKLGLGLRLRYGAAKDVFEKARVTFVHEFKDMRKNFSGKELQLMDGLFQFEQDSIPGYNYSKGQLLKKSPHSENLRQ